MNCVRTRQRFEPPRKSRKVVHKSKEDVVVLNNNDLVLDHAVNNESTNSSPNLQPSVRLLRQNVNEIRVTTPSRGQREISYVGVDDSCKRLKYREWRTVQISALRKRGKNGGNAKEKSLFVTIAPEYPSVFCTHGYKDDLHAILDLLTGLKMSTIILDAYLTRRLQFHQRANMFLSFTYLPVHFFPILDAELNIDCQEPNQTCFPKENLSKETVLIAPQYALDHLYLAVFYLSRREIKVYDSSWSFISMDVREAQVKNIAKYLNQHVLGVENSEVGWKVTSVLDCAQQEDDVNCGCYVVHFSDNEVLGNFEKNRKRLSNTDINQLRHDIVAELLPTSIVGGKLLEAITM